jgi:hypothetical protein
MIEDPELRDAIRHEKRWYVAWVAARYVPALAGALAFILLVVLVPDASNRLVSKEVARRPGASPPGSTTKGGFGSGSTSGGSKSGAKPAGSTPGGSPDGQGSSVGPSAGAPGAKPSPGSGSHSPPVSSSSGRAVSGVKCGSGVRQVTWSPYAPMCRARWSGNNGGATAHGVTDSTITLVLRNPSDWDSAAEATGTPKFAGIAHDTQVLVDFFNRQFELWGRKVIVKTFNGRGSFFAEGANKGQEAASADAQTAYDLGAFVDGFPISTGTYSDAEAARRIISFAPGNSLAAYKAHAPYMYGVPLGPVADIQGAGVAAVACQRMAKMKAVFAGDPLYQTSTRTFAILEPEQPEYAGGGAIAVQQMKKCGAPVQLYQYSADVSSEPQQAAQITARMQADHVTTVLMLTDPLMSQFMTHAATQEGYKPEWVFTVFPQALTRQADQNQMAHSVDVSPWHATTGAPAQRLCARIYQLADAEGSPQSGSQGLDASCSLLLALFSALQQAGPVLTPQSFNRGWFTLPDSSTSSDFGRWSFGSDQWSPDATMSVLQWNATQKSRYDNGTGQWEACGGPADYPYRNANLGSGQLHCHGQ